jgi:carbamate kinase
MRVVIALGGNALLKRGEELTASVQLHNVIRAASAIAQIVNAGHDVIITHGNGPQIGLMALQDVAYDPKSASPLDVLCAESQGMIGYMIAQELQNALGNKRTVATLLTRIAVDPLDPAFGMPSKPIGPLYGREEAEALAAAQGWTIMQDGPAFRRAVPSPQPKQILDIGIIRQAISSEEIVICCGGGGIPVIKREDGTYEGVEAVIDKDHASRLVASLTRADALLMLTDVDGVYAGWGAKNQALLRRPRISDLESMEFPAGTMKPKIDAAIAFALGSGRLAGIGRLEDAMEILGGSAGTMIEA